MVEEASANLAPIPGPICPSTAFPHPEMPTPCLPPSFPVQLGALSPCSSGWDSQVTSGMSYGTFVAL